MADAPVTAPAAATSTPAAPAPVAPAPSTPAVAAAAPSTPAPATTPTSQPTAPVSTGTEAAPAATEGSAPTEAPAPLFTLPEDVKLAPEALGKFDAFLRGKLSTDGKVSLTSQEVVDQFLTQAKDANERWAKQIQDTDAANAALCKSRFTPAQLSQAESAVGFFSSYEPGFHEFAKRQLNDPVFVNAMRIIGEKLSEDVFEPGPVPVTTASRKSPAERMGYAKPKTN